MSDKLENKVENKVENTAVIEVNERFEKQKDAYAELGLSYDMSTFEYCANNSIDLDALRRCTPENNLTLVLCGVESKSKEKALELITKWTGMGYSIQMLHIFALKDCKKMGFSMSGQDLAMLMKQGLTQEDVNLLMPTLQPAIAGLSSVLKLHR